MENALNILRIPSSTVIVRHREQATRAHEKSKGQNWSSRSHESTITLLRKKKLEGACKHARLRARGTALRNSSHGDRLGEMQEEREAMHMAERSNGGVGRKKSDEIISACPPRPRRDSAGRFSVQCEQSVPVQRPIWRALLNVPENDRRKDKAAAYGGEGKERNGKRESLRDIAMRAKLQLLLFALLLVSLLVDVSAQRRRKHRRRTTTTEASVQDEVMNMLEADEIAEEAAEDAEVTVEDGRNEVGSKRQSLLRMDPCMDKHCGAGRVCKVIDEDTAECVCVETCDEEVDPRRKVCTNYNETFGSDCQVYQARCFCDTGDTRCTGPDYQHVHIEYYGECRQMPMCKEEDMADFPRRMRDWLFNIMRDLADRQELPSHYLKMQREAETNHTLRWTNAAIWKWCDLDGHPHDRAVSRHELFPIRAPLMALEHCIAPFLDSCDINNDHKISLLEWGKCLQLDEDDLDDKCDELAEAANSDQ